MRIKCFFNKQLKYSNRIADVSNICNKIESIESVDYIFANVVSFNGYNGVDANIIIDTVDSNVPDPPTYLILDDNRENTNSTFSGNQYYVTNSVFLKKNLYRLTLIRDILANHYKYPERDWRNIECYIENGSITNQNDSTKYNRYNFNLNMIKKKETLLSDKFSIVSFYTQRRNSSGVEIDIPITNISLSDVSDIYESFETMNAFNTKYPSGVYKKSSISDTINVIIQNTTKNPDNQYLIFSASFQMKSATGLYLSTYNSNLQNINDFSNTTVIKNIQFNYPNESIVSKFASRYSTTLNQSFVNNANVKYVYSTFNNDNGTNGYLELNNKIVMIEGIKYKVSVVNSSVAKEITLNNSNKNLLIIAAINTISDNIGYNISSESHSGATDFVFRYNEYSTNITITPFIEDNVYSLTLNPSLSMLKDTGVKCFGINNLTKDNYQKWIKFMVGAMTQNKEIIQSVIIPANIYLNKMIDSNFGIITDRDHKLVYNYIYNQDEFEEIEKECKYISIKSPSYASNFEFTPFLNDGVSKFYVDISLKPFGTIIYVKPDFNGLYGLNFEDKRGLLIAEDYSITNISDAWIDYKYNNQNYLNSFNRQVQSLELSNKYASDSDKLAIERSDYEAKNLARQNTASAWGIFNTLLLNIPSSVGAYTSKTRDDYNEAVKMDTAMNQAIREDTMSATKDMFNYNIGNIKSVAPIVSKVDCFDIYFKYQIIIEEYEATESEKEYVKQYYKNNGSKIGKIDKAKNYIKTDHLFKAKAIVKDNNYTEPELMELKNRLAGGIYV
jgi:hypothetical protein